MQNQYRKPCDRRTAFAKRSIGAVLQYICDKTRLRFKIDDHAVILLPVESFEADDLYPRTLRAA